MRSLWLAREASFFHIVAAVPATDKDDTRSLISEDFACSGLRSGMAVVGIAAKPPILTKKPPLLVVDMLGAEPRTLSPLSPEQPREWNSRVQNGNCQCCQHHRTDAVFGDQRPGKEWEAEQADEIGQAEQQ